MKPLCWYMLSCASVPVWNQDLLNAFNMRLYNLKSNVNWHASTKRQSCWMLCVCVRMCLACALPLRKKKTFWTIDDNVCSRLKTFTSSYSNLEIRLEKSSNKSASQLVFLSYYSIHCRMSMVLLRAFNLLTWCHV